MATRGRETFRLYFLLSLAKRILIQKTETKSSRLLKLKCMVIRCKASEGKVENETRASM